MKTRAEIKLGELTAAMPKVQGERTDVTSAARARKLETKEGALNKVNISHQQASQYELMAANSEIVEEALKEARENDDIVSRTAVLKKIRAKKKAEEYFLFIGRLPVKEKSLS